MNTDKMKNRYYTIWYWIGCLLILFSCTEDEMPVLSLEKPAFSMLDVRNLTLTSKINGPQAEVTEAGFYVDSLPDFRNGDNERRVAAAYKHTADTIDSTGKFSVRLYSPYEIMFKREKPYYLKSYLIDKQGHEIFSEVMVMYFSPFQEGELIEIEPVANAEVNPNGIGPLGPISFSVGAKGYVLGGVYGYMYTNPSRRFFCYDPMTNLWEEPPPIPGKPRIGAGAIEINGKAYVGGGYKHKIVQHFPYEVLEAAESLDDFWEYDPAQKQWTARASLPEKGNFIAFEAHDKGYFLKGKKMWEYDPLADTWTPKPECPINPTSSFEAGEKGYVFHYANLWEYEPLQDTWHEKVAYPGPLYHEVRGNAGKCYVFTGDGVLVYDTVKDVWSTENMNPYNGQYDDINFSFSIQDTLYVNAVDRKTRGSRGFYKYIPQ